VGANPGAFNMDEEIRRFEWKVEAGAEYVVTQPVFDLDLLEAFLKRIEHVKIPAALRHLAAHQLPQRRISWSTNCACRCRKCSWIACAASTTPRRPGRGRSHRPRMVSRVSKMVQGVQLSAPFGRYQMAIDVAEAIEAR